MADQLVPSTPPLGLTLGFFKHFVDLHGGRDVFQGLSTECVCNRFVKPFTKASQVSLVEHVRRHGLEDGDTYAKDATWFVSHAWSYLFLDVVDALDAFFADQGVAGDDIAVWFCMFNNNQHSDDDAHGFHYWAGSFQLALVAIQNVVMVLSPWNNPTTLTRTWCVFEMYVASVTNARFEVAMGATQLDAFFADIQDANAFGKMLATIKSEASKTEVVTDRDGIVETLSRAKIKFADLDRMLLAVLQDWVSRTVQRKFQASTEAKARAQWSTVMGHLQCDQSLWAAAQTWFEKAVAIYRNELQGEDPAMWKALAYVAFATCKRNQPRLEWEPLFDEALTNQQQQLGYEHDDTLTTMYLLGWQYIVHGEFERGMPLLTTCFEMRRRRFGADAEATLDVMNAIGMGHSKQANVAEAEAWTKECYDRRRRVLGDDHPNTMSSAYNLALEYSKGGKLDSATAMFDCVYKTRCRVLGPDHDQTWSAYSRVGNLHRLQGQYDRAEAILRACVEASTRLGQPKPLALLYTINLGMACFGAGNTDAAQSYLGQAHTGYKELYGPAHGDAQFTLYWRCLVAMAMDGWETLDQLAQAEQDMQEAMSFHDTWTFSGCTSGTHKEKARGLLFTCSKCPKYAWRACGPCVKTAASFCSHAKSAWETLKPPARFLQEKRLTLLAQLTNWSEYQKYCQVYAAYCAKFEVPKDEQVEFVQPWSVRPPMWLLATALISVFVCRTWCPQH
ncbi:Aste57867_15828 [Aphanomyces stellatus]|uniref:Aste57867_15828 protein n=1 Tax=Aphanomyces stellatus TaxID=120398 RepID=A0A485L4C1_9STRA|nr:hypothetical protein As57867_015772 [Aphanomyces stellatus]VFT92615.1 Aste57867_15828 [Aphanomyces stellatus]